MSQTTTANRSTGITREEVEELLAEQRAELQKQFEEKLATNNECIAELEAIIRSEREEKEQLREELAAKEERIEALEQESEERATVEWRGDENQAKNLWVGNYPLGKAVKRHGGRLNEQDSRITDLERGEVDVDDVLDHEGTENQLPIQRDNAARKSDAPDDLSANQERATFVWAAFHERAVPGYGKLRMESSTVKRILELNDFDTNPNTVRRTMEFVAKGTSRNDNLSPEDDGNLITLRHGESCNSLVADQDEWEAFFAEQMEHAASMSDDAQDDAESDEDSEVAADGDAAAEDISDEMDNLSTASAVTPDENDSVTGEITLS